VSMDGRCGGAGDAAMVFASVPTGSEPSSVITGCFDLSQAAVASLRFSYSKVVGRSGPRIDASADLGATWGAVWNAPAGAGGDCANGCADLAAYCGRGIVVLRLSAGTADASGVSMDDLLLVRDAACPSCVGLPGDLDSDGAVGLGDIATIVMHWGNNGAGALVGDADGNGTVGLSDIAVVVQRWGMRCP
ncbi:MAG TPA: hypothetical protein VG797_05800, partial [Phycisphaerales bacterium]|nr:hypothetical protein [Phycisphaerales bacterium]